VQRSCAILGTMGPWLKQMLSAVGVGSEGTRTHIQTQGRGGLAGHTQGEASHRHTREVEREIDRRGLERKVIYVATDGVQGCEALVEEVGVWGLWVVCWGLGFRV
jgi:hypothetical protein